LITISHVSQGPADNFLSPQTTAVPWGDSPRHSPYATTPQPHARAARDSRRYR